MSNLYELTEQYRSLSKVEDLEPDQLADTLEGLTGEIEAKANAIAIVLNTMGNRVSVIDAEIDRLKKMKSTIENQDKSVREYLRSNMAATGISSIKCDLFSITLAKGRDVVVIDDESQLPDEYLSVATKITPDKRALLAALKDGETIAGASLTKSAESLRIK